MSHQSVERSPQRRDVGSEVELALAQYGVQLQLLLFAHRVFSSLSPRWARVPCRRANARSCPSTWTATSRPRPGVGRSERVVLAGVVLGPLISTCPVCARAP